MYDIKPFKYYRDKKAILKLIENEWTTEFKNKFHKWLYAKKYLLDELIDSNYGQVIYDNKKLIGVLLGSVSFKRHNNFKYKLLNKLLNIFKLFDCENRYIINTLNRTKLGNNELKIGRRNLDNQITLLIVDNNYREKRLGSDLLYMFEEQDKVNSVYLFTDNFSNYNFYIRNNYKKINSYNLITQNPKTKKIEIGNYYLYYKIV